MRHRVLQVGRALWTLALLYPLSVDTSATAWWSDASPTHRMRRLPSATEPSANAAVCGGHKDQRDEDKQSGTIEGRVFDEAGKTLQAVSVSVQRIEMRLGIPQRLVSLPAVLTDRDGDYRVQNLLPGQYYVSAVIRESGTFAANPRDRGGAPKRGFGPTFFPGTTRFTEAARVFVYPGQYASGVDIHIERKRLARVSGRLVTQHSAIKDGAYVALVPAATVGRSALNGFFGTSRVGSRGDFIIDGVPPGEYVLQGRSIPLRDIDEIASTGRSAPLTADSESEFGSVVISVDGADITDVGLSTGRGGSIRGTLTIDGKPLRAGRRIGIQAEPTGPDALSAGVNDAWPRGTAEFQIKGLRGEFVLRLAGDTRNIGLLRVEADGSDVSDMGLLIGAGNDVDGVEVALTSHPTRIAGRVESRTGEAPDGCWVIVFADDPTRWSYPSSRYVAAVQAEVDGVYQFEGLPAGDYLIVAVSDSEQGDRQDPLYLRGLMAQATRFKLHDAEHKAVNAPLRPSR